jgi:PHD/YefM family antitoxin component YafN of YafNO toxin-antitoxin module
MIATEHTQSLSAFRKTAAETIARLNRTGDAEIITVNGEARAVLISPAVYDELAREAELSRDVAAIQRAMKELDEGKGVEAKVFFAELRSELLAMKAAQQKDAAK